MAESILILTSRKHRAIDLSIDLVARAIRKKGGRVRFVETDRYPADAKLSLRFDDRESFAVDADDGRPVRFRDVSAVWVRHTEPGAGLPSEMPDEERVACATLGRIAFDGATQCFPDDVFVLDRYDSLQSIPLKPRMIQMARALGLDTPRTLVTNDPAAVRSFSRACKKGVIVKMIESSSVTVTGRDGREEVIYTRTLEPDEGLEGLEISPMIFQERVPKALELRVTVVGRKVFTASIDSAASSLGMDDWRRDRALARTFRASTLPPSVEGRLLRLLDRLGLNFATVDLIVTPEGRYVFLEVNAVTFFDFVEEFAGLPISDAVAELLLGRAPPRIGRLHFSRPKTRGKP